MKKHRPGSKALRVEAIFKGLAKAERTKGVFFALMKAGGVTDTAARARWGVAAELAESFANVHHATNGEVR